MLNYLKLLPETIKKNIKFELKRRMGLPDTYLSLQKLKSIGFKPKFAVDVGAYKGDFSVLLKQIFPTCKIIMVEPQSSKNRILDEVCRKYNDCSYINALVGAENKNEVNFILEESNSRIISGNNLNKPFVKMRQVMLDCIIKGDAKKSGLFASPLIIQSSIT